MNWLRTKISQVRYPRLMETAYYAAWIAGLAFAPQTTITLGLALGLVLVVGAWWKWLTDPDHSTNEKG